jgi:glycosyltransferase involved in cell wall biosynthesis
MMPVISVIVPVYNVEKFLPRCIDSILVQTFVDFECILVDDGSVDRCPAICDEYATKDKRIVVIHQKNAGTAHARDAGIRKAQGDFISFVDSDDWLEKNALELLYNKQQETNADIVLGGFRHIYAWCTYIYKYPKISENMSVVAYFLFQDKYLWGRLYKKILFANYIIPDINILEDGIVNIQIFIKTNRQSIQIIDDIIYNYDHQTNGIVIQIGEKTYNSCMEYPMIHSGLWIEEYLKSSFCTDEELSACALFLLNSGIIPYLRNNKKIIKKEISFFYNNYYKKCTYLNLLIIRDRVIIPLLHFSFPLGKFYLNILRLLAFVKKSFRNYSAQKPGKADR